MIAFRKLTGTKKRTAYTVVYPLDRRDKVIGFVWSKKMRLARPRTYRNPVTRSTTFVQFETVWFFGTSLDYEANNFRRSRKLAAQTLRERSSVAREAHSPCCNDP